MATTTSLCAALLFASLAACFGSNCDKVRDVEVVVQLPIYSVAEKTFFSHIAVQNFIIHLHNIKNPCWKLTTKVIDSDIIDVSKDGLWAQEMSAKTPEDSLNEYLVKTGRKLNNEYTPDTPSKPKRVVVLVVGDSPTKPEHIADNSTLIQELHTVFVVVGVDLFDPEGIVAKNFKQIAKRENRQMYVDSFQELESGIEFDNLVSILDDPERVVEDKIKEFNLLGDDEDPEFVLRDYSSHDNCSKHLDIAFVIDGSGSLQKEYFKELQFVMGFAKTFNVSKYGSHAGVIQFSKKARLSIKLNEYTDADDFALAVKNLKPQKLLTRIDRALVIARDQFFEEVNGGRPDKHKLLVLITDGNQTKTGDYTRPEEIAEQIRAKGINILVIGVGDSVDEKEMAAIAGPNDNWRRATSFNELRSREFLNKITRKGCDIDEEKECEHIVDLVFLFDGSGSIDEKDDYPKMKEFAIRIANKFGISEAGAHGGLVIFSDLIDASRDYYYSKIALYLKDAMTPSTFRQAIERAEYLGYRTRIDLGLDLAEQVFDVKHGGRPNVKKVIILLTDGAQNPNNPEFDPVKKAERLLDNGINIYAVGIGRTINYDQLLAITKKEHRVFRAADFKALESTDFVKNVSTTACKAGHLGTTPKPLTMTPTPTKCVTPKPCGGCCGGCPVFNNIFNLNLGTTYVVSGAQISKDGTSLGGGCAAERCKTHPINNMNMEQLMKVIKTALDGMCKGKCTNTVKVEDGNHGTPAIVRDRRSISRNPDPDTEKLSVMLKLSRTAGCSMFMQSLKKHGIMKRIKKLMKEGKYVTLFCPIDKAFWKIYKSTELANQEKTILLNHVGLKHDKFGTMYHTLSGDKIIFNAVGKQQGSEKWKANGADVIISLADGINTEIIIIKDVILPRPQISAIDVLKKNENLSVFYNMFTKSGMRNIFKKASIEKICFTRDMCVSLSPVMVQHLTDAIKFDQFTIVAPTNKLLKSMDNINIGELMANSNSLKEFLQGYVYLGNVGNPDSENEIGYSLSSKHSVLTTSVVKGATILTDSVGNDMKVKSSLLVKEGRVLLVEKK